MKRKMTRFLSLLIAALMLASLLPAAALADDGEARIYTSPDGLDAGQYYFDMNSPELLKRFENRRYAEKLREGLPPEEALSQAKEQAALDVAAFRQAEWYIDTETFALNVSFPQDYDPSGVFSLESEADAEFMIGLIRLAKENTLVWNDVAVPSSPNEIADFAHNQYFINLQRAYVEYYDEAFAAGNDEQSSDEYAVYVVEQLLKATYGVRPDDPLFRVKMTYIENGEQKVLYYPYEIAAGGSNDVSRYVVQRHDYLDICHWDWTDEDHVTAWFECYLGRFDGEEDIASFDLSGSDIKKTVLREATETTDGLVECTASVLFYDSIEFKDVTYTDTHTFVIPATGNPQRLSITKQPQSAQLNYPEGVELTVEVDDPDFAAEYQWFDTDALGRPMLLDGITAKTPKLVLPATTYYDSGFDLFCEITDLNGNKTVSDVAHVEVVNRDEHKPVFYVGDHGLEPGDTLDLSQTYLGTGTVSFAESGNEVTLDNVVMDIDTDRILFDTKAAPNMGLFAAASGCAFRDGRFYIHVKGDCSVNCSYYDVENYASGIGLTAHFLASDSDNATRMVIDGDGSLTLRGGVYGIHTDYELEIDTDLKIRSNGQNYMSGISANGDVYIDEGAKADIQTFGHGIFVDCRRMGDGSFEYHDLHIADGAAVKIDATAPHVYSLNTELYGMIANGNIHIGKAKTDIALHAVRATMEPYGGRISAMTGMSAFNIALTGSDLTIDVDAEKMGGELYANGAYGISGESLQRISLTEGAKVSIDIDTPIVRDAAEGVESGWTQNGEGFGLDVEGGSELDVSVKSSGMAVFGIDLANPVSVTDAVVNVSVEPIGSELAFGASVPDLKAELSGEAGSVTLMAENGIAFFAADADSGTEFDIDHKPAHILMSGKAKMAAPANGVINCYGFPYFGSVIPGETVYGPMDLVNPAQRVVINTTGVDDYVPPEAVSFSDVADDAWYREAVEYVAGKGLMNGIGGNKFDPDGDTTRGMLVTILYRLEGEPAVSAESPFADVPADAPAWYTNAVLWAAEKGIVLGYADGGRMIFDPNGAISREQFAAILYRYEQYKGGGFTGMWYFRLDYEDAADVSEWADEAMHWCVMNGIINGCTPTTLVPQGSASRAQPAAILMRYIKGAE
jgi:hypothetical protein